MSGRIMGLVSGIVGDRTMALLERGLDVASLRHNAISNNVANADTPGYKRRDVSFEGAMREAASVAFGPEEEPEAWRLVQVDTSRSQRNDGNNVDVDYEMTLLAQNTILYNALARQLSQKMSLLRTVITEGRR